MFQSEKELTKHLKSLIEKSEIPKLKDIYTGEDINRKISRALEKLEKYYNIKRLKFLAIPDLVLVFKDWGHRYMRGMKDEPFIIAIELKFLSDDKKLRQAYREFGQPLRYFIHGYDSTVLWHVFPSNFNDDEIRSYTKLMKELVEDLFKDYWIISRMKIETRYFPIFYISTKIISNDKFVIYYPSYNPNIAKLTT